ncbi:MAG: hypothetical protein KDH20_12635 [Rhodocyclaceae bacterium]|nr:hypothetical protein [Rhodocyclaceae bacterium]
MGTTRTGGNALSKGLAALGLALTLAVPAQADEAALQVTLADGQQVRLSGEALAALPRQRLEATAHGVTQIFEGPDLRAVLTLAGIDATEGLRGRAVATVVIAEAGDGYRAAFALAELDPTIGGRIVLVADRADGEALPEAMRPWRLVVPGEGRPTRWVWNLERLRVVTP